MGRCGDNRTSPAEPSLPSTPRKRKLSPIQKQSHHHHQSKKKQRLISNTEETLTLKPNPIHTSPSTNHSKFQSYRHTHSHTHTHKKYKRTRNRKSTSTEGCRNWVYSKRDFSNYRDRVVFVSYNILGVENASNHADLYYNIPPKFMDWDNRKKLICKEINHYNPSILCLQEVDRFDDLDYLLRKDGFTGVYQARTGEASDGCAIFWKNEMFTLLHLENMEFRKFGLRDNVAQLCVLKMTQNQSNTDAETGTSRTLPSRSLLVGNIHVLFNPNRGDIKLGQIRLFVEKAHELSQEWGCIPVVLGGDLNSMPQSAIYQFLASSELDIQLHDRRKLSGQICPLEYLPSQSHRKNAASCYTGVSRPFMHIWSDEELRLATGADTMTRLTHHLKLCSAYVGVPGSIRTRDNFGEPLATSYHSKFMGTVDFLWHTEELIPVRVLETLPIDILRKTGGLPSEKWGSDHLALVCELAFADDDNGT